MSSVQIRPSLPIFNAHLAEWFKATLCKRVFNRFDSDSVLQFIKKLSIRCRSCAQIESKKDVISDKLPPKEVLENEIYANTFVALGLKYEVSDTTIKKWCKKYGLPYRRKDLKNTI